MILAMSSKKKPVATAEMNFNALLQAIKSCLVDKQAIREAARGHGIDKSTLQRHLKKVGDSFEDINKAKDDELLEFLRTSSTRTPSNMVRLLFVSLPVFLEFFK